MRIKALAAALLFSTALSPVAYSQVLVGGGDGGSACVFGTASGQCLQGGGDAGTPSNINLQNGTGLVPSTGLNASGTPGSNTYLAGSNEWKTLPGGGDFSGPASSVNNNFVGFNGTGGKTGQDSGYNPASFAPAGAIADVSSSQAVHAADVAVCKFYRVSASSLNFTFDATSTPLSTNGCIEIETLANAAQVTANAADTVSFAGTTTATGGNVSLPAYGLYRITIKSGNIDIAGKSAQGNGTKVQLAGSGSPATNDCAKFDANGNIVTNGSACGGSATSSVGILPISGNWYYARPYANMTGGSALTSGTIYFDVLKVGSTGFTMAAAGVRITGTSAGGLCQIGVWALNASGGAQGAPLAVSATMSTTSAALVNGAFSGGIALSANTKYKLGLQCDNGATAVSGPGLTSDTGSASEIGVTTQTALSNSSTNYSVLYSASGSFSAGSMPTTPGETGVQSNAVRSPGFMISVQ